MYYVYKQLEKTFGQTDAGCHASTNTSLVGEFPSLTEAVAAADEAMPHGNRDEHLVVAGDDLVATLRKQALEASRGDKREAFLRNPNSCLVVGWGSVMDCTITRKPMEVGINPRMDGGNLSYQKALLGH